MGGRKSTVDMRSMTSVTSMTSTIDTTNTKSMISMEVAVVVGITRHTTSAVNVFQSKTSTSNVALRAVQQMHSWAAYCKIFNSSSKQAAGASKCN